jgi:hypothetical protein
MLVFSIGRGQFDTPRPEVIDSVRHELPGVRIACTQLSEKCAARLSGYAPSHLNKAFARGKERGVCCAGTVRIEFGDALKVLPDASEHGRFIKLAASSALCNKQL